MLKSSKILYKKTRKENVRYHIWRLKRHLTWQRKSRFLRVIWNTKQTKKKKITPSFGLVHFHIMSHSHRGLHFWVVLSPALGTTEQKINKNSSSSNVQDWKWKSIPFSCLVQHKNKQWSNIEFMQSCFFPPNFFFVYLCFFEFALLALFFAFCYSTQNALCSMLLCLL